MFDYLIIGKGLIGAAAFRYLTKSSANTAVLGPDEPVNPDQHQGVFGAYHDEGRLSRRLRNDEQWAALSQRAYATYLEIEHESGLSFFTESGSVLALHPERDREQLETARRIGRLSSVDYAQLAAGEARQKLPFLHFPNDFILLWEQPPSGFLNPRRLVRAQLRAGQLNGGQVIRETAVGLQTHSQGVTVRTQEGGRYEARRILLATGAFSNCFELLPQKLALRLKTEYVALARLPESEVARLQHCPTVVYQIDSPELSDIYLTPPLPYPDGHHYLKMGANTHRDRFLTGFEELAHWYRAGDSDALLPAMRAALEDIFPGLQSTGWQTARCVITYTDHGQPYIDVAAPGQLYVAVGGNGRSASVSDPLGRLAADLVINDRWRDPLPAERFAMSAL